MIFAAPTIFAPCRTHLRRCRGVGAGSAEPHFTAVRERNSPNRASSAGSPGASTPQAPSFVPIRRRHRLCRRPQLPGRPWPRRWRRRREGWLVPNHHAHAVEQANNIRSDIVILLFFTSAVRRRSGTAFAARVDADHGVAQHPGHWRKVLPRRRVGRDHFQHTAKRTAAIRSRNACAKPSAQPSVPASKRTAPPSFEVGSGRKPLQTRSSTVDPVVHHLTNALLRDNSPFRPFPNEQPVGKQPSVARR